MSRLRIIEVLKRAWKPVEERDLTISVHAGDRDRESRGMRFIIGRAGEPFCCVKRLPLGGPFDPASILATQQAYAKLESVSVPEVLGWTQDDESLFIVEQFIPSEMRLDDAVRLNALTRKEAENLVADLLHEILDGSAGNAGAKIDVSVDEDRIVSAIEGSPLKDLQKTSFRRLIFETTRPWHPPVWTSRDFLPRNILLNQGRPYLVDFDLACRTGLLAIDALRTEFYTDWRIPFRLADGEWRDDPSLRLLFLILEEKLQRTIAGASHHQKWLETYGPRIEELAETLPTDVGPRQRVTTLPEVLKTELHPFDDPPPDPAQQMPRPPGLVAGVRHRVGRGVALASKMRPGVEAAVSDVVRARIGSVRQWERVASPEIKYWLDFPGDWRRPDNSTLISGWCYSDLGPVGGVRAVMDGRVFEGGYGTERNDVKAALGDELPTSNVGFWVPCPVRRGFNRVTLEVLLNGRWLPLCRSLSRAPYFPAERRPPNTYDRYIELETERLHRITADAARAWVNFDLQPLISIVMPTYKPDLNVLSKAVESVRNQIYGKWELCVVDDASHDPGLAQYLKTLGQDDRIKSRARETNGNIAAATNDGIAMATGEWVALLDHDDELSPDALYEVVAAINKKPDCDVLYSDQDKIDADQNRSEPFFKPDWSPWFFRGVMYLGHLLVVRRKLLQDVGGCDSKFDGVQDFELALRLSERANRIEHIPRILYHWRAIPGSVAANGDAKGNINVRQAAAVQAHLDRLGIAAVAQADKKGSHRLRMIPKPRKFYPKISIVIPTRDHPELIGRCLKTLFQTTRYPNFEVVIGDNETKDAEALRILDSYPVRRIPLAGGFHFSRFMNILAAEAAGEYLMFLNNDTEIIQPDWLDHLLLYAEEPTVGAAGALLTYEDGAVQHAGIILGPRGTADHIMRGFPVDCDGYMGSLSCTREVTAVTAAAALLSRRKFRLVGGFCERFQRHYDDLDLCLRLRSRGFRNIAVSTSRLVHHESRSRGSKYDYTDRILLLERWESLIDRGDPYYSPNFAKNSTDYRIGFGGLRR